MFYFGCNQTGPMALLNSAPASRSCLIRMKTRVWGSTSNTRCSFSRGCSPEVKEDGGSDISQTPSGIPG